MNNAIEVCVPPDSRLRENEALEPVYKVATTDKEIEEYFRIRHDVFVKEQKIFEKTDRDKHDEDAIPILACYHYRAVGAVRCYPNTKKTWFGGRLAVELDFRTYNIGAMLVHKAVETMENHPEVRRFLATIQFQNVRFFQRLGWKKRGKIFYMKGKKHHIMEKVLDKSAK
ncbi:MAG: MSMEG_0567/Sll0786 family nitrogen starvation N-acetyltransferase [Nitrospinota bacterium]